MGLLGLFLVLHGAPPARSDELVLGLLLMGIAGHDVWAGAKGRPPSWWLPFRRTQATEQQYHVLALVLGLGLLSMCGVVVYFLFAGAPGPAGLERAIALTLLIWAGVTGTRFVYAGITRRTPEWMKHVIDQP